MKKKPMDEGAMIALVGVIASVLWWFWLRA